MPRAQLSHLHNWVRAMGHRPEGSQCFFQLQKRCGLRPVVTSLHLPLGTQVSLSHPYLSVVCLSPVYPISVSSTSSLSTIVRSTALLRFAFAGIFSVICGSGQSESVHRAWGGAPLLVRALFSLRCGARIQQTEKRNVYGVPETDKTSGTF